jgi:hypothetical protein
MTLSDGSVIAILSAVSQYQLVRGIVLPPYPAQFVNKLSGRGSSPVPGQVSARHRCRSTPARSATDRARMGDSGSITWSSSRGIGAGRWHYLQQVTGA